MNSMIHCKMVNSTTQESELVMHVEMFFGGSFRYHTYKDVCVSFMCLVHYLYTGIFKMQFVLLKNSLAKVLK